MTSYVHQIKLYINNVHTILIYIMSKETRAAQELLAVSESIGADAIDLMQSQCLKHPLCKKNEQDHELR